MSSWRLAGPLVGLLLGASALTATAVTSAGVPDVPGAPGAPGSPAPVVETLDLTEARRNAAVEPLRAALERPRLDRASWQRLAHGSARSLSTLTPLERERVERALENTLETGTALERIAAAELVHRLLPERSFSTHELARLRVAAFGGLHDSAAASAARRILTRAGDWSDRLRLVQELESAVSDEERDAAVWCLRDLRSPEVLADLARLLAAEGDPRVRGAAAAAAGGIVDRLDKLAGPAAPDTSVEALRTAAQEALADPACPFELAQRCCALLGRLDDAPSRALLERLAREGSAPAADALARRGAGRTRLAAMINDPLLVDAGRVVAAGALAAQASAEPRDRERAIGALCRIALTPGPEADAARDLARRRAAALALAAATADDTLDAASAARAREALGTLRRQADAEPALVGLAASALE